MNFFKNVRKPEKYIAIFWVLACPHLSMGQIQITKDTLSNCWVLNKGRTDPIIIQSEAEYQETDFVITKFYTSDPAEGCWPFGEIEFDKSILVGFVYEGSNCDRKIEWSKIVGQNNDYILQFRVSSICRDRNLRIAWFIVDKPKGDFNIKCERK